MSGGENLMNTRMEVNSRGLMVEMEKIEDLFKASKQHKLLRWIYQYENMAIDTFTPDDVIYKLTFSTLSFKFGFILNKVFISIEAMLNAFTELMVPYYALNQELFGVV